MYLRHTTISKNGKSRTYWRLVRSVRNGTRVRQETVASLGELDAEGRAQAQALARNLTGIGEPPGTQDLFSADPNPAAQTSSWSATTPTTMPGSPR